MMKYYCNFCNNEIQDDLYISLTIKYISGTNHYCTYKCLYDSIKKGKECVPGPSSPVQWTSVKESLPETEGEVIVCFFGLYKEIKISFYSEKIFYYDFRKDNCVTKWITHWMPLPKLPEEETI